MLEELMNVIRAGGTLETRSLATRLGTSPELVEAMLEHLQRSGFIQDYAGCADGCQGCDLRTACQLKPKSSPRLWQSKTKS